jgi:hypothetical protein
MTDLERAIEQISFARGYSLRLIDNTDPADWFRIPPAGVSHIAWQVGHLAYAQYRMTLVRIRGQQPGDKEFIPEEFLRMFGIKSTPEPDASHYPPAAALRETLERVHARVLQEVPKIDPAILKERLDPPHSVAKTKLDSLFWCSAHELIHAGQIGLLRRQLGQPPLW